MSGFEHLSADKTTFTGRRTVFQDARSLYYNRFVTRRELLAGSAACAGILWAREHWDRSRISVITDEIATTPDDAASFAHESGIQFVEVRNLPGTDRAYAAARDAESKSAATLLSIQGVKVAAVDTTLLRFPWPGSPSADQARWDRRMEDLQRALRCAQITGADKVLVFSETRVADPPSTFERLAATLTEMAAECEKQKVTLLLENDPATNVATCADLAAIMKLVPSKWVGISWKPAPEGYSMLPRRRILNVRVPAASLSPGRPENLNWRSILTALDKDGYSGRVTLEAGAAGKSVVNTTRDALDQLAHVVREVS